MTLLAADARDLNSKPRISQKTPLHLAVEHGREKIALTLLRSDANVDSADGANSTTLVTVASNGRADLVTILLLASASVDFNRWDGRQALHLAVQNKHGDVVKILLNAGADPFSKARARISSSWTDMTPLNLSLGLSDTTVLRELLPVGINARKLRSSGDFCTSDSGAREGRVDAINISVGAGADPGRTGNYVEINMPLHHACKALQLGTVQALLRRGTNEDVVNGGGKSPRAVVGDDVPQGEQEDVRSSIRETLERPPADRVRYRRAWVVMLSARRKDESRKLRLQHEKQRGDEEVMGTASKRNIEHDPGGESSQLRLSLKIFHATVTKLMDVSDELVFRRIVTFL